MKFKFLIKISFFLLATILLTNCSKEEIIPEDIEINNFVWGGMNAFYKFQGDVDDLADTKFTNRNELNEYLEGFDSPVALFNSLTQDSYSQITNDYTIFEDQLEGYVTTNGLDLKISEYTEFIDPDTFTRNYAYVFNITEGSDAEANNITTDMIFTHINGTRITAANFDALSSNDNLTLTEAELDTNTGIPVATGNIFSITSDTFEVNAISYDQIITEGTEEIGYFVYNHFGENYIEDLNTLFGDFKTNNIDNLIIDLRFNVGTGSTKTATYLGSMITGQFTDDVFSKQIWNDKVMTNVNNENLVTYFTDEIDYDDETSEFINSLGLEEIYFITSNETNAASLLLINSLVPYIDVHLIGDQTGNNHFVSSILYDSDDYTKNGENFNTSHTWAIKPIVFEVQNKNNTNNANGYAPDLEVDADDTANVSALGNTDETVLRAALDYISGINTSSKTTSNTTTNNKVNTSSNTSGNMVFSF